MVNFQEQIDDAIKAKNLYFIGARLPADWYEAFQTWIPFADAGDAKAQFNIGYCYRKGLGVDQSLAKAFEYYSKAMDQGDPRAHYDIGLMYNQGVFVEQSLERSEELFRKAAELGSEHASSVLTRWAEEDNARKVYAQAKEAYRSGKPDDAVKILSDLAGNSGFDHIKRQANKRRIAIIVAQWGSLTSTEEKTTIYYDTTIPSVNGGAGTPSTGSSTSRYTHLCLKLAIPASWSKFVEDNISSVALVAQDGKKYSVSSKKETDGFSFRLNGTKDLRSLTVTKVEVQPYNEESHVLELNAPMSIAVRPPSACFVLTACYGYPDEPTVRTFREFRDKHLSQSRLGQSFIDWYYVYGPQMADFVRDKPKTKAILRSVFKLMAKMLPK